MRSSVYFCPLDPRQNDEAGFQRQLRVSRTSSLGRDAVEVGTLEVDG